MKMFYEKDVDVDLIKNKKIAIFGYGSQGQAQALNLKDSGVKEVVVALRDGSASKPKAESKGLKVMNLSDAAEWAEIVMILIPDKSQAEMYSKYIEQYVKEGTSLAFANGSNIRNNVIIARGDLDVFIVAPKGSGKLVRSEFEKGVGVQCSFAVHQNCSGEARNLAMSYASAIGGGKSGIIEKTFKDESEGKIDSPKSDQKDEVISKEKNPSANSFGTGFFVNNEGHIITNFHVVNNSNNIKILYNDDEVDAKLIESDQQLDLALLKSKVENKNYIKFSNKSPQKAQNILVAGFPFGKVISNDLKITGGIINSLKGSGNDTTRLQIDATINPGNSGGPIVDKVNGSLVGVAVAKLNKDFTKEVFGVEGENTNYGIKASQVRDFLESNNINVSVKSSKLKISELEGSTVFIYNK